MIIQNTQKYIPHILAILFVACAIFFLSTSASENTEKKSNPFLHEQKVLEETIQNLKAEKEEKRVKQLEIYEAWKKEDAILADHIAESSKRLEGLNIYLWTANSEPVIAGPWYSLTNHTNNSSHYHEHSAHHPDPASVPTVSNIQWSSEWIWRSHENLTQSHHPDGKTAGDEWTSEPRKPEAQAPKPAAHAEDPQVKYWQAYDAAIPLIHKHEGLHLKAYWDYKGCSIGYGSRAKSCSEVISVEEADRRLSVVVRQLVSMVQRDFSHLSPKQQGALVSFAFNCHDGYVSVRKHGLHMHRQWCRTAGGKVLKGLINRRSEEAKILFDQ